MSAAILAALAVIFLLASEQLANLALRLRCRFGRVGHKWERSRMGGLDSCKRCPARRVAPPVDLADWRRLYR